MLKEELLKKLNKQLQEQELRIRAEMNKLKRISMNQERLRAMKK